MPACSAGSMSWAAGSGANGRDGRGLRRRSPRLRSSHGSPTSRLSAKGPSGVNFVPGHLAPGSATASAIQATTGGKGKRQHLPWDLPHQACCVPAGQLSNDHAR